jgi:hypothetical protein
MQHVQDDFDMRRVKCWHEGRVRVHGTPHPGIEKWTKVLPASV